MAAPSWILAIQRWYFEAIWIGRSLDIVTAKFFIFQIFEEKIGILEILKLNRGINFNS